MKTFSVRFYKRLILVFLALLILIPTVFAVFFGIRSADLERQLAERRQTARIRSDRIRPRRPAWFLQAMRMDWLRIL